MTPFNIYISITILPSTQKGRPVNVLTFTGNSPEVIDNAAEFVCFSRINATFRPREQTETRKVWDVTHVHIFFYKIFQSLEFNICWENFLYHRAEIHKKRNHTYPLKLISGNVKYSDCFCRALRLGKVQKKALATKHAHCFWLRVIFFSCCFFSNGIPWTSNRRIKSENLSNIIRTSSFLYRLQVSWAGRSFPFLMTRFSFRNSQLQRNWPGYKWVEVAKLGRSS